VSFPGRLAVSPRHGVRVGGVAHIIVILVLGAVCGAAGQGRVPGAGPGGSDIRGEAEALRQVVPSAAASTAARGILDCACPAMIQIKGFFGTNTAEAFHGSGFAVARGGVFVTNWHVVSDAVLYSEKYRLEYRTPSGASGRVTVRAIDIRHDLALVEAHGFAPGALSLRPDVAIQGERAYSIGFPLDVGLTITEGVSSGRIEDSFEPRIHYSGALNAGMSGGPGLDGSGSVIGINVAGYRASQLVAFLVPAEHAVALLARAEKSPLDGRRARDEVASQLRAHSEALLDAVGSKLPTQNHLGYELPAKPAAFVECHAAGDPAPDQPVLVERVTCDAKASVDLGRSLNAGGFTFQHQVMSTDTLDAWRFAHRMQETKTPHDTFGLARHLAPFACQQHNVELNGFTANTTVCLRAYRKFDGIYDLNMRIVSKNRPKRGFVSSLSLRGVAPDRALAFVRTYLDAMRWNP
jgi:serine protease Do